MNYTVRGILQTKILEWVAIPFSRGSSQPRDQTLVSCIAGGFFTSWATGEAQINVNYTSKRGNKKLSSPKYTYHTLSNTIMNIKCFLHSYACVCVCVCVCVCGDRTPLLLLGVLGGLSYIVPVKCTLSRRLNEACNSPLCLYLEIVILNSGICYYMTVFWVWIGFELGFKVWL